MKTNQADYPRIYLLAMDIIPIPASAVPCERVFSSGKHTMTQQRSQISGDLMEALQMLKYSIRQGGRDLDFTKGLDWDIECQELESIEDERKQAPDDLHSFSQSLVLPH